jgi:RimJ/RimL family protein N-acetyltransferase
MDLESAGEPLLKVGLRPWREDDLPLMERLLGDPNMTEHLGGPESPERLRTRLHRYMQSSVSSPDHMFVVVLGPDETPVGSVGYWRKEWQGRLVWETGWHVLREFQGRGIATRATRIVIQEARLADLHRYVHAFPSVQNTASNAVCRKLGFVFQGECDFEYPAGHPMRCNDWQLDLHVGTPA